MIIVHSGALHFFTAVPYFFTLTARKAEDENTQLQWKCKKEHKHKIHLKL